MNWNGKNKMRAKQRDLTIALIAFSILLIAFFGLRAAHAYRRIEGARLPPEIAAPAMVMEADAGLVRDWMTIPYIAKTYGIPDEVLFDTLEIPERGNREKSLAELNLQYYPASGGIVIERIKAAILAYQPSMQPASP
jgi:hypothetical protein